MPDIVIGLLIGLGAGVALLLILRNGRKSDVNIQSELAEHRKEAAENARHLREELREELKHTTESLVRTVSEMRTGQKEQLDSLHKVIADRMKDLVDRNEKRLEKIQETVSEKLQSTLEKRLGESFRQVSERLEKVHQGLGDMQKLASGVGDLKKMLTNVKKRGTWGEVQLGAILEQILAPEQFEANVETIPGTGRRVEFAIRLPGKDPEKDRPVWLPVDAKFPQEDYLRLVEASEQGDPAAIKDAVKALENAVKVSAKDIQSKYIQSPHTTDFGILFLPTEGLYAEVLRIPGLAEQLQREFRVMPAGPTTFSALLNSLRIGFQTLAIEQRTSEVWTVLRAVKSEFGKFGDVLDKVQKQLKTASSTLEKTGTRTRAMARKLKEVEELPTAASRKVLELPDADLLESNENK